MDPVNPTPVPVRDPSGTTETLPWPLRVQSAELACVMVSEDGEVYTLTTKLQFKDDAHDIVIIERSQVEDPAPTLAKPSRYFMELKGEMVPEPDGVVYKIEQGDPRETGEPYEAQIAKASVSPEEAMTVQCPSCQSLPDVPCVTIGWFPGQTMKYPHENRYGAARVAHHG